MNIASNYNIDKLNTIDFKDTLTINDKDFSIWIDVLDNEGKMVHSGPGHSFTSNFLSPLIAQFSGLTVNHPDRYYEYSNRSAITSVQSGVGGGLRINWSFSGSMTTVSGSDKLYISGAIGYPEMNGIYDVNNNINNDYLIYTTIPYNAASASAYVANSAYFTLYRKNTNVGSSGAWYASLSIRPGYNPTIDSASINLQISDIYTYPGFVLTYNTQIVSPPTQDATQTEMVITRTYTNNRTNTNLLIDSIVLQNNAFLMAYDRIPLQTLQPGKTLTVNYRIRTNIVNNGGLLFNFIQFLYRQFLANSTTVTITDIYGTARTYSYDSANNGDLRVAALGANNRTAAGYVGGQNMGIRFGIGQDGTLANTVDTTPALYEIQGHCDHGTGSNQLYDYGTSVYPSMSLNTDTGTASFDIVTLYENKSGADVNVTNFSLVNNYVYYGNRNDSFNYLFQVALYRKKLSNVLVIPSGSFIKATLTLQLVASPFSFKEKKEIIK